MMVGKSIENILAFGCFLSIGTSIYKADFSVSIILFVIYLLGNIYKHKLHINYKIPKDILLAMSSLGVLVLLSCASHGNLRIIKAGFEYIYWMLPFFMFWIMAQRNDIRAGVKYAFYVSCVLMCSYGYYEYFILHYKRVNSFYGGPNQLATIIELLLPFTVAYYFKNKDSKDKIVCVILFFMCVLLLWMTGSRGAWLGVIAAGMICTAMYLYFKNNGSQKIIVGMCVLMLLVFCGLFYSGKLNRSYDYERVYIFQSSIEMWKEHKLIGVGVGEFGKHYQSRYINPKAKEIHIDKSHNIVTAFLAETGIIGTTGFVLMNVFIYLYLINLIGFDKYNYFAWAMLCAFMALSLHGVVDSTFNNNSVNRLFWGLLGITCIHKDDCSNNES